MTPLRLLPFLFATFVFLAACTTQTYSSPSQDPGAPVPTSPQPSQEPLPVSPQPLHELEAPPKEETSPPRTRERPRNQRTSREPPSPTDTEQVPECTSNRDCVTASFGPDCCPACRAHAYTREALEELRAYCSGNRERLQSCPILACMYEDGTAVCQQGRCVIMSDPSIRMR